MLSAKPQLQRLELVRVSATKGGVSALVAGVQLLGQLTHLNVRDTLTDARSLAALSALSDLKLLVLGK